MVLPWLYASKAAQSKKIDASEEEGSMLKPWAWAKGLKDLLESSCGGSVLWENYFHGHSTVPIKPP